MKILVDRLTEAPKPFHFEGDAAWWRDYRGGHGELDCEAAEPFALDVRAHMMGEDIYLEGSMHGAIAVECSRCLARYRHPLREDFQLVLEPAGERMPADPESARALARDGMCLGDELDAGWYRGPEIDLEAFFAEMIALALPIQPLCREDCAGLCPQCGIDRNTASCDCAERKPDSPFAVLSALRVGEEGGDA
jgi:uncharacterized protein